MSVKNLVMNCPKCNSIIHGCTEKKGDYDGYHSAFMQWENH